MSPLEAVLLLQILLTFINLITVNTINDTLWALYNKLPFSKTSAGEKQAAQMRRELVSLSAELRATSAQDDFAKWARLRRKLDKMQEEYKAFTKANKSFKSSFVLYANGARWLVTYGFQFYIQIRFSRHAVFWLPKGWLPWLGEWVVSFPAAPRGAVSLQVWQLACRAVIGMIADAIMAAVALLRGLKESEKVPEPMAHSGPGRAASSKDD